MKVLLGAALILVVLYLISGSAITKVVSLGQGAGEQAGARKLGYSPFKISFKNQYLCYDYTNGAWATSDHDNGEDCKGPFIESVSLCNTLAEEGQSRVRLFYEGRVLDCGDAP